MRICYYNSVRIVRKELNMGMSSYILDCEDKFWDDVEIIKESDTIKKTKTYGTLEERCSILDEDDVFGQVEDYWNDFWSNYL